MTASGDTEAFSKDLVLGFGEKRVPFWETDGFWGIPPPPRISGIIDLEENREIIYGAQQLAGKILIRKELSPGR